MPRRTPGTDNRVLRVCRLLNAHRVRYVIAGGVAANLHGSVRATKDVDVLVPADRANLSIEDLRRSKDTGRPIDLADLETLGRVASRRERSRR